MTHASCMRHSHTVCLPCINTLKNSSKTAEPLQPPKLGACAEELTEVDSLSLKVETKPGSRRAESLYSFSILENGYGRPWKGLKGSAFATFFCRTAARPMDMHLLHACNAQYVTCDHQFASLEAHQAAAAISPPPRSCCSKRHPMPCCRAAHLPEQDNRAFFMLQW